MQARLTNGKVVDLVNARALFEGEQVQWRAIADRQSGSTRFQCNK